MKANFKHDSVLPEEVIGAMNIRADGVYVDGTFGRGGHARAILACLDSKGKLIVLDKDPQAIEFAHETLGSDPRVSIIYDDFDSLDTHLKALGLDQKIDAVLLDLGVSSPQLDDGSRGFSFKNNGPLDMRMDRERGISAAVWLKSADEKEIARVLWELGEERQSRKIARRIIEARVLEPITTTAQLASLIQEVVPASRKPGSKHPATRSFQAIRIHINQELDHIVRFLDSIFDVLEIGGRLLVISFHSLEDRIVKRFIRNLSTPARLPKGMPIRDIDRIDQIRLKAIGKAVKAGALELSANPRARSAVLRIAERIA
ncbi:MAG: 16S rRNA (cytosine1402-N4)-methyltransferase [Gammaproteobacteria bacterium]|jgi:16S rRNA (cytosine1402-N4)-methyltransferase